MSEAVIKDTSQAAGRERNHFIDTLRGIAIFGVICVHFCGSFANSNDAWTASFYTGLALNQFFNFSVPLFVFISGLLASPYRPHREVKLGTYYKERLLTIAWPYLVASIAAFFLLSGHREFFALSTDAARVQWLVSHFLYYGTHPTFYFIPMILLLYFMKPFLAWLAPFIHGLLLKKQNASAAGQPGVVMLVILSVLLLMHVVIGILCYQGKISYYTWCRPNPIFWAVYFYFGLTFPLLSKLVPVQTVKAAVAIGVALALGCYFLDWKSLTDTALVGQKFELNNVDYAYVRPVMLALNLFVVLAVAGLLALGVSRHNALFSYLGKHSLQIYLWHIMVLYLLAWKFESVMGTVKNAPELMVAIALLTGILIAGLTTALNFLLDIPGKYHVEIKITKNHS